MSLFSDYLKERTSKQVIETKDSFVVYSYTTPTTVYLEDIFVSEALRCTGEAARLADLVAEEARAKGCTKMVGSVVPSAKGSTISLKVLLGYGMVLDSATNDFILFSKEL